MQKSIKRGEMAKFVIAVVISLLAETKSNVSEFYDENRCSCSEISDQFSTVIDLLQTQRAQSCRKICPSGFDYLPEVDGCFKVMFQSVNWHRAGEICRKVMPGVHLVAITDPLKQTAIGNYLQQEFNKEQSSACLVDLWTSQGKSVWISGQTRDPLQCGTPFVWKTLEGVEIPFNYTKWIEGEPNCSNGGTERCAHIVERLNYGWNDAGCEYLSCALCEF